MRPFLQQHPSIPVVSMVFFALMIVPLINAMGVDLEALFQTTAPPPGHQRPVPPPAEPEHDPADERWLQARFEEAAAERRAQAERESAEARRRAVKEIKREFEEAKERVPDFSSRLLSLTGKWNYIRRGSKSYRGWVEREFEERVLDQEALDQAISDVVESWAHKLDGIVNQAILDLAATYEALLEQAFEEGRRLDWDPQTAASMVQKHIRELETESIRQMGSAMGVWVGQISSVEMAVEIIRRVFIRTGIIGGAAVKSSKFTLGVSLVIGFIVEQAIDRIIRLINDPRERITEEVRSRLDDAFEILKYGQDEDDSGLVPAMNAFTETRLDGIVQGVESAGDVSSSR